MSHWPCIPCDYHFPGGASGKESTCQCRRHKRCNFDPWVGKSLWRMKWQPTLVFLPGKFHGQRSLAGYSPWDCKELDTSEWTHNIHDLESEVGSIGVAIPSDAAMPASQGQHKEPFPQAANPRISTLLVEIGTCLITRLNSKCVWCLSSQEERKLSCLWFMCAQWQITLFKWEEQMAPKQDSYGPQL